LIFSCNKVIMVDPAFQGCLALKSPGVANSAKLF